MTSHMSGIGGINSPYRVTQSDLGQVNQQNDELSQDQNPGVGFKNVKRGQQFENCITEESDVRIQTM